MPSNYYSEEDVEYDMIHLMDKEFMGIRIKLWLLLIVVVVAITYIKKPNNSSDMTSPYTGFQQQYGYY